MTIEMPQSEPRALGKLKGADYNPREMPDPKMRDLMRSIREFGFVQPVVARREDGLLLGGHQRVAALRRVLAEDGHTPKVIDAQEIPVVFLSGVDDARARALNLALNKISGDWDYAKLADVLRFLSDVPELPIEITGFTVPEVGDILGMADLDLKFQGGQLDPDREVARARRHFVFDVSTDEMAELCRQVLQKFGMTGPGDAAEAFVAALRAASQAGPPRAPAGGGRAARGNGKRATP